MRTINYIQIDKYYPDKNTTDDIPTLYNIAEFEMELTDEEKKNQYLFQIIEELFIQHIQ